MPLPPDRPVSPQLTQQQLQAKQALDALNLDNISQPVPSQPTAPGSPTTQTGGDQLQVLQGEIDHAKQQAQDYPQKADALRQQASAASPEVQKMFLMNAMALEDAATGWEQRAQSLQKMLEQLESQPQPAQVPPGPRPRPISSLELAPPIV